MDTASHTDKILYFGFPLLFPLGKGLDAFSTGLTRKMHAHLFKQFSVVFAQNQNFIFFVFNLFMRKLTNSHVKATLGAHPEVETWFGEKVRDPEFLKLLQRASRNPSGIHAQEAMRLVAPYVKWSSAMLPFSDGEQRAFSHEIWALAHRYGEPSHWITVSPSLDTLSFRFSFPSLDRTLFPATTALDEKKSADINSCLNDLSRETFEIPQRKTAGLEYSHREDIEIKIPFLTCRNAQFTLARYAAESPVACAEVFRRMLDAIFEILLGIPSSEGTRKTALYEFCEKGIAGFARAFAACGELQGRGALHVHIAFWSRLCPFILQWIAGCPALIRRLSRVVESHINAFIPRKYHVDHMLRRKVKSVVKIPRPFFGSSDPVDVVAYHGCANSRVMTASKAFHDSFATMASFHQIHAHSATCHKPKLGPVLCRMARPFKVSDKTEVVELDETYTPRSTNVVKLLWDQRWVPKIKDRISPLPSCDRRPAHLPLRARNVRSMCFDTRILKLDVLRPRIATTIDKVRRDVELFCFRHNIDPEKDFVEPVLTEKFLQYLVQRLTEANGRMVETNDVLSVCTHANTNMTFLGTASEAKSALQYLSSYMVKTKTSLSSTFALMATSRRQIMTTHVSKAEDTGTAPRTAKHFLARLHNMTLGAKEFGAAQCALYLLGVNVFHTSERFQKCYFHCAQQSVLEARSTNDKCVPIDGAQHVEAHANSDDEAENVSEAASESNAASDGSAESDYVNPFEKTKDVGEKSSMTYNTASKCRTYGSSGSESEVEGVEEVVTYKRKKPHVAANQHTNYAYRGLALAHLNLLEYVSIIDEPSKPTATDKNGAHRGRLQSARFDFDDNHPLVKHGYTHNQKLLSLQKTPIITGKSPPRLPKAGTKNVNKKLDDFAKFYLLLFKPWDQPKIAFSHALNFEVFCEYVQQLDASTIFWERQRLAMLQSVCECVSIPKMTSVLLSTYRLQNASRWSESEDDGGADAAASESYAGQIPDCLVDIYGGEQETLCQEVEYNIRDILQSEDETKKLTLSYQKALSFLENIRDTINSIHDLDRHEDDCGNEHTLEQSERSVVYEIDCDAELTCQQVLDELKRTNNHEDSTVSDDDDEHGDDPMSDGTVYETTPSQPNNIHPPDSEQQSVIDIIVHEIEERKKYVQSYGSAPQGTQQFKVTNFILHGPAGCGKTNTVRNLQQAAKVLCVATTGVAATNIPGATTVHSRHGFDITVKNAKKYPNFADVRMNFITHDALESDVYLVDETSLLTANWLAVIEAHLRFVRSKCTRYGHIYQNMPFGGMVVVLTGDFFQLPAVRADALYTSVMKFAQSGAFQLDLENVHVKGVRLFQGFQMLRLTRQHRLKQATACDAAEKTRHEFHASMLDRFRNETYPLDDDATIEYLEQRQISRESSLVTESNSVLDKEWRFATYIVTNNAERIFINWLQALRFAKDTNTLLLWWPTDTVGNILYDLSPEDYLHIVTQEPCLKEYFVANAPCFLTTNISPSKGLANGTKATMHSLVFETEYESGTPQYGEYHRRRERQLTQIKCAKPGSVVQLFMRPSYVNIKVFGSGTNSWTYASLPHDDADDRYGIVPIPVNTRSRPVMKRKLDRNTVSEDKDNSVKVAGFVSRSIPDYQHPVRQVQIKPTMDLDLGFALTVHKCQGATLGKVILDIGVNPFKPISIQMLYVALTRVRSGSDLRLLPFMLQQNQHRRALQKLQFPLHLRCMMAGFRADGFFDSEVALKMAQLPQPHHSPVKSRTGSLQKSTPVEETKPEPRVRSLPDVYNNISFVNVCMHLLANIFYSHITTWEKPQTCVQYLSFEKFMTVLAEPPRNGERRMLSLTQQSTFYGLPLTDMIYPGILKVLPKHKYMAHGTPTPNPGEFLEVLLHEFRWTQKYETRCTRCCKVLRCGRSHVDGSYKGTTVLWVTMYSSYVNASIVNIQDLLSNQTCSDPCQPPDYTAIQVVFVDLNGVTAKMSDNYMDIPVSMPLSTSIVVGGANFHLQAYVNRPQDDSACRQVFNKNRKYHANLRIAGTSNEFQVRIDSSDTHTVHLPDKEPSWQEDLILLMYVREDSIPRTDVYEIRVHDRLVTADNFHGYISHVIHTGKYQVSTCLNHIMFLTKVEVIAAKRRFQMVANEAMAETHACACQQRHCWQRFQLSAASLVKQAVAPSPDIHNESTIDTPKALLGQPFAQALPHKSSNTKKRIRQSTNVEEHKITRTSTNVQDKASSGANNQKRIINECMQRARELLENNFLARACALAVPMFLRHEREFNDEQINLYTQLTLYAAPKTMFFGCELTVEDLYSAKKNVSTNVVTGMLNSLYQDQQHNFQFQCPIWRTPNGLPVFYINYAQLTWDSCVEATGESWLHMITRGSVVGIVTNYNNVHWYLIVLCFSSSTKNQLAVEVHDSHLEIARQHHPIAVNEVLHKLISMLPANTAPEFLVNAAKNPSFTEHRRCIQKDDECGLEVANNFRLVLLQQQLQPARPEWLRSQLLQTLKDASTFNSDYFKALQFQD